VEELTYRPARTRRILTTLEVCVNKKAGPYGSVELIVSNPRYEHAAFYCWPLDEHGTLLPSQFDDFTAVMYRECTDTLLLQVNGVQQELPDPEA
jgi:hypothetical protein